MYLSENSLFIILIKGPLIQNLYVVYIVKYNYPIFLQIYNGAELSHLADNYNYSVETDWGSFH